MADPRTESGEAGGEGPAITLNEVTHASDPKIRADSVPRGRASWWRHVLVLFGALALGLLAWRPVRPAFVTWSDGFLRVTLQLAAAGLDVEVRREVPPELLSPGGSLDGATARDTVLVIGAPVESGRAGPTYVPDPWGTKLSSFYVGYLPFVVFLAFAVATPIAWRSRRRTMVWGLVALHGLYFLRVALYGVVGYRDHLPVCRAPGSHAAWLDADSWALSLANFGARALDEMSIYHVPVALVWLALTWRSVDWRHARARVDRVDVDRAAGEEVRR